MFSSAPLLCSSSARWGEGLGLLPSLCLLVANTLCWSSRWALTGGSHSMERGAAQVGTLMPRRLWVGVGRAWACMPLGVWPTLWLSCPHPALVQRGTSLRLLAVPSERGQEQGAAPCGLWARSASPARGFHQITVDRFKVWSVMSSGAASLKVGLGG